MSITAAAASLVWEEFPAVTEPTRVENRPETGQAFFSGSGPHAFICIKYQIFMFKMAVGQGFLFFDGQWDDLAFKNGRM